MLSLTRRTGSVFSSQILLRRGFNSTTALLNNSKDATNNTDTNTSASSSNASTDNTTTANASDDIETLKTAHALAIAEKDKQIAAFQVNIHFIIMF